LVERSKLVPTDDLAAADAVRIVQHDVDRLDIGVIGEEGFGLGQGGARRAGVIQHGGSHAKSSVRISSKAVTRRSICRFFVNGLTSIMLWNGAIRQPRFRSAVCSTASTSGTWAMAASVPLRSGPGAQMNSTRAPTRTTCQGAPWVSITRFRPVESLSAPFSIWA